MGKFNRPRGMCPCCGETVEFYTDGIGGPHEYRCGNCFHGLSADKIVALEALQKDLEAIDAQKAALIAAAL